MASDTVLVPAGILLMGSRQHYPEERPLRHVDIAAFRMDVTPVTNRDFAHFVEATGYVTLAEKPLDPALYPGIPPTRLYPGALVFVPPPRGATSAGPESWWVYKPGAWWRHPEAAKSVFAGRLDHPVTCVAYDDALAYARWAGKRLPTEPEWEWAARGGLVGATYAWGEEWMPRGKPLAHVWHGHFPNGDTKQKGRPGPAKVRSFPANQYGLHDMIGNVWEWTSSWYQIEQGAAVVPNCCTLPEDSYDPEQPAIRIPRRVLKGGSFLCAQNYCERYRPAARQPQMIDTASVHIGFRCATGAD